MIKIKNKFHLLNPDKNKIIALLHIPPKNTKNRIKQTIKQILSLSEKEISRLVSQTLSDFSKRHKNLENILMKHFSKAIELINDPQLTNISIKSKLLIGSYFTKEYAFESAAICNPSIMQHPNQANLKQSEKRIIISFRTIGEKHISSVIFRSGIIDEKHKIKLDKSPSFYITPNINFLSNNDYEINFENDSMLSERVLYPISKNEQHGIEDVRWTKFFNSDGTNTYYGLYTAYNGTKITPKILQTNDFKIFTAKTLTGKSAKDKNLALFPRKINGQYAMISRTDGVNIHLMYSKDLFHWSSTKKIQLASEVWELTQTGNCGPPIETKHGWLLLTHGVGPMRKYAIGIELLDLENPQKIIGKLKEPLLSPNENERNGYVPNVVYSCGSIVHNEQLILAYAYSDIGTKYTSIPLKEIIDELIL
jgi:predicted GH43/DUF377 family glycosyl hydrolase